MSLTPGTRLGPYEIVAPLGAGGMGEVYRAKDSRLGREVAVKVLPQHLCANAEVRARFEREAKTVSSLNHPHICTLHDVGREGDSDYLVMELVEGETLASRLGKGALPVADVLRLGAQIADALDRAHRAGVIHRDLKPGNVMLTKNGAKLMDFGLARATGLAGPASSGASIALTQPPTMAQPLTAEGTIVGTFQYMAPEQLEGKEADARSDLWALGCVLYEMATGKRAFEGATQASLISAIMRDHPRPMRDLSPMSPPVLDRLVNALLAKDPDDRIQTAHDVKLQLQWMIDPVAGPSPSSTGGSAMVVRAPRAGTAALAWGVAGIALALTLAAWLFPLGRGAGHLERARLIVSEPPNTQLGNAAASFAISPNGRLLALAAADSTGLSRLWVRPLDALAARALPGTEHADAPFWSPDCRSLGFFADGKLKTIRIEDGTTRMICEAPDPRGGTWGRDGVIVFAPTAAGALFSVPEDGGTVTEQIRPDSTRGETALRYPCFLPDGQRFTFVTLPARPSGYAVHLGRLGSSDRKLVMLAETAPVFAEPGWLITVQSNRLVAQRFDARSAKVSGRPLTLGEAPVVEGPDGTYAVSASHTGILAYPARLQSESQVAWLDRSGRIERKLSLPVGRWEEVTLSPDGTRALLRRRRTALETELWVMDVASAQATRIAVIVSRGSNVPIWSPDGRRTVYTNLSRGPADLLIQFVDGGQPEVLYKSDVQFNNPYGWSPDGRLIAFESPRRETGWDVWGLPVEGDRKPIPLVQTPFNEGGGWFSPDGRWLVYMSDETGGNELYVQSFPARSARSTIPGSRTGARYPGPCWWSRDGREILFNAGDGSIRAVEVEMGATFRCGRARVLFETGDNVISLCPTPDHRKFLATVRAEETSAPAIVIDMHWPAALRRP
jgi:dipeptidyl aminopeptidase/acylaminoacyl peptidase